MKNLSFKFVIFLLLIFLIFSHLLYVFDIPSFMFPHIAILSTIFFSEKNIKKRLFIFASAIFLYSQTGAPLSIFFMTLVFFQIYIITSLFFSFTAFDFSLTALINSLLVVFVINLNRFFYIFAFTGQFKLFQLLFYSLSSSFILILIYIFYKPNIDGFFVKDSWL